MIWLLPVWEWNVTNLATILLSYIVWVIDFRKSLSLLWICSYFLFMCKHDKLVGMCTQMILSSWLKNHEYLSIFLQLVNNHMLTSILLVDGYLWLSFSEMTFSWQLRWKIVTNWLLFFFFFFFLKWVSGDYWFIKKTQKKPLSLKHKKNYIGYGGEWCNKIYVSCRILH